MAKKFIPPAPAPVDPPAVSAEVDLFAQMIAKGIARKTYREESERAGNDETALGRRLAVLLGEGAHVIAGHVLEVRGTAVESVKRVERVL
jgi:hypothetical protein